MIQEKLLPKSLITKTRSLLKHKEREEHKLFLCEGVKCCKELIASDYQIEYIVINENELKSSDTKVQTFIKPLQTKNVTIYVTASHIFENLCDAASPQGVIAIAKYKNNNIQPNENFVALDNISDPGNVGTIIRTALWFGIKQILLFEECASLYNPKVIRSSMGAIFHSSVVHCKNGISTINEYFSNNIILSGDVKSNTSIKEIIVKEPFGLIIGNESRGISAKLDEIIDQKFIIPGSSGAESLNVAIAAGIAIYELM